ncbi:helix-turn-helix domain-containing protein [Paenibacillus pasadenensis]|uniref:DNA-3-methyladenine glycosylase 2 family protein n=1 Tax=Paenibacillus pasadenensis TaxID=217090 RepID=UPI002041A3C1|nr:AlkA N-terminal domain-containing protein [Paenibacillus pasadenensis]MCM3747187.1 helix-turn-helix domain-containing protein [Paenibacillus pasadenensis]
MTKVKPTAPLDHKIYYPAFKSHDARFDGRVYVAVSSTGIYCRPVCRVKMPKEENCAFYNSAAAAEAAGFRPCLRCRPELAPGFAPIDAPSRLSRKAALLMEDDCLYDSSMEQLAKELHVTDRHLRRSFMAEYGVSPVQYLQTYRLLLAKNLMTDTTLPVTDVAFTAGFGSVRRFNAVFKKHYRMSPSALRKQAQPAPLAGHDSITLYLGYRPPYLWSGILAFLGGRSIPGVELVTDDAYHRTVVLRHNQTIYRGWISVQHAEKKNMLALTISGTLLPVLPKVLMRIKHLFDLHSDPAEIYDKLAVMNRIKEGMCVPGTRLPGSFDSFEMAVRAVLGQQITVKAARTLATRIVSAYGSAISTPVAELTHTFPTPEEICSLEGPIENHLGVLGVTGARAKSIHALASALLNGDLELSRNSDPDLQLKNLLELPGFGPWTVQYIAMRALGWPDAFPHTDYGVKKALSGYSPKEILELAEQWRPWRSYATINLWNSLN